MSPDADHCRPRAGTRPGAACRYANWYQPPEFGLHEIAVTGSAPDFHAWDGCFEISPGRGPIGGRPPAEGRVAADLHETEYLTRLIVGPPGTIAVRSGHAKPANRPIGVFPHLYSAAKLTPQLQQEADRLFFFNRWRNPPATSDVVLEFRGSLLKMSDWEAGQGNEDGNIAKRSRGHDGFLQALVRPAHSDRPLRQVSMYVCFDAASARLRLVSLLMRFGAAQPQLATPVGAVATAQEIGFVAEGGAVVVGAVMNVVVSVTRASRGSAASIGADPLYSDVVRSLVAAAVPPPPPYRQGCAISRASLATAREIATRAAPAVGLFTSAAISS